MEKQKKRRKMKIVYDCLHLPVQRVTCANADADANCDCDCDYDCAYQTMMDERASGIR